MIVLDADVYDTLELSALAYGGIGGQRNYDPWADGVPWCVLGHARLADVPISAPDGFSLIGGAISPSRNDAAVRAINMRRGRPEYNRVPFADWCAELGIVRGPHPEPTP